MLGTESGSLKQREDAVMRVTGWCNGGTVRANGSLTVVAASTLSQMPHGRWKRSVVTGMSPGVLHTGALTSDAGSEWTAQIFRCDSGVNIGMTRYRPTAMVYDGTDEELVWSLTAMLPGARVERRTSNSGVTTHLVHSDRRVDTRAMLAAVGLNVTNTNPMAHHPLQSFITHGATVATTPTHRDENNAILVQLKGPTELLIHPPALSLPGCPASVFGDAAATTNPRWLEFDPFQLHRTHSSLWVKVVLVPGDAVVVPKLWWHAVRSTPGSVAISVPVQLDTIEERSIRRRTCRRDAQSVPMVRKSHGLPFPGEQLPNFRRTDYTLGADDPVAHYYALTDTQFAADCRMEYKRLEGRVVTWHTGGSLLRFADVAAAELGLGAQQTAALLAWMTSFQLRPTQGGAVLAARVDTNVQGEPDPQELHQVDAREREHEDDGRLRYLPADSYTDEGELRVYTQPLSPGARPTKRSVDMARYAVHDVVNVRLASCMEPWGGDESDETHVAFVIHQHDDGTCDVRLADDLLPTVLGVHTQFSTDTIDADTRERLREYDSDIHSAVNLYTESGAHVSRHATSVARVNDKTAGGSARSHNDG